MILRATGEGQSSWAAAWRGGRSIRPCMGLKTLDFTSHLAGHPAPSKAPNTHELRNQCDHIAENPGISVAFGDADLGFPTRGPPPGGSRIDRGFSVGKGGGGWPLPKPLGDRRPVGSS